MTTGYGFASSQSRWNSFVNGSTIPGSFVTRTDSLLPVTAWEVQLKEPKATSRSSITTNLWCMRKGGLFILTMIPMLEISQLILRLSMMKELEPYHLSWIGGSGPHGHHPCSGLWGPGHELPPCAAGGQHPPAQSRRCSRRKCPATSWQTWCGLSASY